MIDSWTKAFGANLPVGYLLRESLPDRWLRIHSLPQSKRYAETTEEYAVLLARQNEVATTLLGVGSVCTWVVARYIAKKEEVDWSAESAELGLKVKGCESWGRPHYDEDVYYAFGSAECEWRPGAFDDLIRLVADDAAGQVLCFSHTTSQVYSPYDGGADLFFERKEMIAKFRERWSRWLSYREDGL